MDKSELYSLADKILAYANSLKIDYADVKIQSKDTTSFALKTKEFEGAISGSIFGVGVRVIHNGKLGFYSSNKPDVKHIVDTALKLSKLNPSNEKIELAPAKVINDEYSPKVKKPMQDYAIADKVNFAKSCVSSCLIDSRIKNVDVSFADSANKHLFANSEGTSIMNEHARVRILGIISGKENTSTDMQHHSQGGYGFEALDSFENALAEKSKILLSILCKPMPQGGRHNVLLGSECTGLLVHEAVGHACEADAVIQNCSILKNKLNQKIGSDVVNITDASALENKWGSYKYDDEGTPSSSTKLIENGVLKSYLHSRETAMKFNTAPTGNARAESFASVPIVRMSNTFFEQGNYKFEELLEAVKNGYYLCGSGGGGQVSVLAGTFTFASGYAHKIENGKLTNIHSGCSFSGNVLDVLPNIFAVGNNKDNFSVGMCGKDGQYVPVSQGIVHVAVKQLSIGGK